MADSSASFSASRRRRLRTSIGIAVALVAVVAVAFAVGGRRFHSYAHGFIETRFQPLSVGTGPPDYFYLDWRYDMKDPARRKALLGPDSIVVSPRDRQVFGKLRRDPLRIIQADLAVNDLILDRIRASGSDPAAGFSAASADEELRGLERIYRRQLDWLVTEGAYRLANGEVIFPHFDDLRVYGLKAPWLSALTQGQAISLLVRAATLTGDRRYAECADAAVRAFQDPALPIVWRDGDRIFFEEYPCDPPSHVLNGCIFAWFGLWDYARFRGDENVRRFCLQAMENIRRMEPSYEIGNWTRYSQTKRRPTSPAYHEIHASQAEALAAILNDPVWAACARRWRRAAENPFQRSLVFVEVAADKLMERLSGGPAPATGLGLKPADLPGLLVPAGSSGSHGSSRGGSAPLSQ